MLEGVGVITQNEKDEFLLQLRDAKTAILTNQWCLIGGSREKGEDIEQTVRREVKEETNLDIVEMKYLKKFQFNSKEIGIFIAKVNTAKERIKKTPGGSGFETEGIRQYDASFVRERPKRVF